VKRQSPSNDSGWSYKSVSPDLQTADLTTQILIQPVYCAWAHLRQDPVWEWRSRALEHAAGALTGSWPEPEFTHYCQERKTGIDGPTDHQRLRMTASVPHALQSTRPNRVCECGRERTIRRCDVVGCIGPVRLSGPEYDGEETRQSSSASIMCGSINRVSSGDSQHSSRSNEQARSLSSRCIQCPRFTMLETRRNPYVRNFAKFPDKEGSHAESHQNHIEQLHS
jgi:hypothetical protein